MYSMMQSTYLISTSPRRVQYTRMFRVGSLGKAQTTCSVERFLQWILDAAKIEAEKMETVTRTLTLDEWADRLRDGIPVRFGTEESRRFIEYLQAFRRELLERSDIKVIAGKVWFTLIH